MESKQFAFNIANIHQLPKFLVEDTPLYVNTHNNNNGQDYVNSEFGDKDYNFDLAENIEDESVLPDLPLPFYPNRNFGLTRTDEAPSYERGVNEEEEGGLSSDSLAFTITYCSVFTITLVYVAIKLVKRWRMRTEGTLQPTTHQISWCGHAHCSQVQHSSDAIPHQYLPYAGLGSAFIPSMVRLPPGVNSVPLSAPSVHASAACNDGCDSCRRLAQPPPSYTKLFLEEQPPTYGDAVAKQEEEVKVEEVEGVKVEVVEQVEDSAVVEAECVEDSAVVGEVVDDIRDSVVVVIDEEDGDDRRKRRRS